jgi:hypothetical protein
VSNPSAGAVRDAGPKELKRERRVNALRDQLIGTPAADDPFARGHLHGKIKRRLAPIRPSRETRRKERLKKPHFHHNHRADHLLRSLHVQKTG